MAGTLTCACITTGANQSAQEAVFYEYEGEKRRLVSLEMGPRDVWSLAATLVASSWSSRKRLM